MHYHVECFKNTSNIKMTNTFVFTDHGLI